MTRVPIVIKVENGEWNAYTQGHIPTQWDRFLLYMLHKGGGIADTVEDGVYYFNAEHILGKAYHMTLVPVPEEPESEEET